MKKIALLFLQIILFSGILKAEEKNVILLNGIVQFEQTRTMFPPNKFTRKIPVPGLIDLAIPKIEQYEEYFSGTHEPRYSWYKFTFDVTEEQKNKFAILKIMKSRFNTQIILNDHDLGSHMQCNTPIEADLTDFLRYDKENVLLVRLGDRAWLPKEAATGFDREKFADFPGIWDDIFIKFSGPLQINRALVLPSLKNSLVIVKLRLENYAKVLERNMEYSEIEYSLNTYFREKKSGKKVGKTYTSKDKVRCQQMAELEYEIELDGESWSPDDPFLYEAVISVSADSKFFDDYGNKESQRPVNDYGWVGETDTHIVTFGMRDFKAVNKTFELNGKEIKMFGSSLTLNRFFEDKDRQALPWDKKWVKRMMIDIPKAMRWNTFRVSIGILPTFWYDLADEYGLLIQNEYPMWNLRGRDSQLLKEYTDWVWTDGNHPSIVIWDAINENKNSFIGKKLIPHLRNLDHTRIWDAGWNSENESSKIEMVEIHWYNIGHGWWYNNAYVQKVRDNIRFGNLYTNADGFGRFYKIDKPLIMNEYGWLWLNRDGKKSAIRTYGEFTGVDKTPYNKNYEYFEPDGTQLYHNRDIYDYYVGKNATPQQRWDFQAYCLAMDTEVIRASRLFSGIMSFSYLTNNGGHTGDWFKNDISKLEPTQGLLVQYHSMKPFAVFIDIEDGRYLKNPKIFDKESELIFNLVAVNDSHEEKKGSVELELLNSNGDVVWNNIYEITLKPFWQKQIPTKIKLPNVDGGYMLISKLNTEGDKDIKQVSRRYINIGKISYKYTEYEYKRPIGWNN